MMKTPLPAGVIVIAAAGADREEDPFHIVRRNVVTYPAAEGRPASTHEDLLVLYAEGSDTKGLYVDGERHVIRYAAAGTSPGKLVLVSDPGPGPRFRLTHDWSAPGTLRIMFEIAPPGAKEFKTYAEGRATRRASPATSTAGASTCWSCHSAGRIPRPRGPRSGATSKTAAAG